MFVDIIFECGIIKLTGCGFFYVDSGKMQPTIERRNILI